MAVTVAVTVAVLGIPGRATSRIRLRSWLGTCDMSPDCWRVSACECLLWCFLCWAFRGGWIAGSGGEAGCGAGHGSQWSPRAAPGMGKPTHRVNVRGDGVCALDYTPAKSGSLSSCTEDREPDFTYWTSQC